MSARPAGDKDWPLKVTIDTVRVNPGFAMGAACRFFLSGIGKAIFGRMPTPIPAPASDQGVRVRHLKLDVHVQIANCQGAVKHDTQGGRLGVKQHRIGTEFGQIDRHTQICRGKFAETNAYPGITRLEDLQRARQYRRCDGGDARERQRSPLDVHGFTNFSKAIFPFAQCAPRER